MKTIYKYPIPIDDTFSLALPRGAQPLTVMLQRDEPQLWALVDPSEPTEMWQCSVVGTGHPAPQSSMGYIGTFQMYEGSLVFHLFAELAEQN